MVNTPGNPADDPFYSLDPNDYSMSLGPDTNWFRFARQGEVGDTCSAGSPVANALAVSYPPFDPTGHSYDVLLDIGPGPSPLLFGMVDCGCADNSGQFILTIVPGTT